jgi:hypothetical protein
MGEDDEDSEFEGAFGLSKQQYGDDIPKLSNTPSIDIAFGSALQRKFLQSKFKQIRKILNTLDSELLSK